MRLPSMPRRLKILALLAAPFVLLPGGAEAEVVARVSLSSQAMVVYVDGVPVYDWAVSTARRGFRTPTGSYRPTRMHRMWYSRKYEMSPMPWSVFYHGGYAIHGTNAVKRLGTPASHGCVRLHTANAAKFYALVKEVGPANTRIPGLVPMVGRRTQPGLGKKCGSSRCR